MTDYICAARCASTCVHVHVPACYVMNISTLFSHLITLPFIATPSTHVFKTFTGCKPVATSPLPFYLFILSFPWSFTLISEGSCFLFLPAAKLLLGDALREGTPLSVNPLVIWAWAGLLINAINSIPAGELDGGRISFALWGRKVMAFLIVLDSHTFKKQEPCTNTQQLVQISILIYRLECCWLTMGVQIG